MAAAAFLKNIRLSDLPPPERGVITLESGDSLPKVLKTLLNERILSAPVTTRDGKVLGFVDFSDLCTYVSGLLVERQQMQPYYSSPANDLDLTNATVDTIIDMSKRNSYYETDTFLTTMNDVVRVMITHHLRRVAVIDSNRQLTNVVTQSNILRVMAENKDQFPNLRRTIQSLELDGSGHGLKVQTVNENATAAQAFKMMDYRGIGSVGIVDDDGIMTGVITARDLRHLFPKDVKDVEKTFGHDFMRIHQPCKELVAFCRSVHDHVVTAPVISLESNQTMERVVDTMREYHIHHIFVTDDVGRPKSCISLSDILAKVVGPTTL